MSTIKESQHENHPFLRDEEETKYFVSLHKYCHFASLHNMDTIKESKIQEAHPWNEFGLREEENNNGVKIFPG